MSPYAKYLIGCCVCGSSTSKTYARQHSGKCKACATGEETLYRCNDCGEKTLTAYQRRNRYHCDNCTRNTDPEGYRQELLGLNDY